MIKLVILIILTTTLSYAQGLPPNIANAPLEKADEYTLDISFYSMAAFHKPYSFLLIGGTVGYWFTKNPVIVPLIDISGFLRGFESAKENYFLHASAGFKFRLPAENEFQAHLIAVLGQTFQMANEKSSDWNDLNFKLLAGIGWDNFTFEAGGMYIESYGKYYSPIIIGIRYSI